MIERDKERNEALNDLGIYKYGAIIPRILEEEAWDLIPGVLENYYAAKSKAEIPAGLEGLVQSTISNAANGEVDFRRVQTATMEPVLRYREAENKLNFGEWFSYYKHILGDIAGKDEVKNVVNSFKDKGMKDLNEAIKSFGKNMKTADNREEREKIKDEFRNKYGGATALMSMIKDKLYAIMLPDIVDTSNRYRLSGLGVPE